MKSIAVLITVYNRKQKTMQSLHNLFSQQLQEDYRLYVYLTNDGCTDGTPEAVKSQFPKVNIVEGDGSLFWNRGMYAAWSKAEKKEYDYFLWLNDDTFLLEGALNDLLVESLTNDDNAIIVGYTLDSERKNVTYGGRSLNGLIHENFQSEKCITFNGNIVLIPKNVYKKLGKNDPYYHHSLGDFDYGLSATKHNIPIKLCDKPCGICDNHPSTPKWRDSQLSVIKRFKYLYSTGGNGSHPREQFYFRKKHYGIFTAILILITSHIHTLFPNLWKKH